MPRFAARRSYRPRVMYAGLVLALVCGGGAALIAMEGGTAIAPYIAGAGALGYFIATIAAMIPQQVTIEIAGREVTPSWRGTIAADRVDVASWVTPGIDAATGLAVIVRGAGGTLVIGGDGHDAEGYALTGKPTRSVDCHVSASQLDALIAELGIDRGPAGPVVVPLIRSGQSFAGVMRTMAPWLITITLLGALGIGLGNTELGARLMASPEAQLVMSVGSAVLALIAIGWMIVRSRHVRVPELELREDDDALVVIDTRRGTEQPAPWKEITVEKLHHTVSSRVGSYTLPLLVLGLPGRKPLRIGAWDTQLKWPGQVAKSWRGPAWIVGGPKWKKLLDVLKRHGRLG